MTNTKIISDPKILGGKPIIAGTRISVELILDRIASGMSLKDILIDYPHLTAEKIQAAVVYAKQILTKRGDRKTTTKSTEPATLYTHEISRR